jgi:hypothetical protein
MDGAALGRVLPVAGVLTFRHPVTAAVTLTLLFGACCLRWARSVSSPAAGTSFRTGGGLALGGLIRRRSLLLRTLPSSRPLPTVQPGLNRSRRPNPFLTDDGALNCGRRHGLLVLPGVAMVICVCRTASLSTHSKREAQQLRLLRRPPRQLPQFLHRAVELLEGPVGLCVLQGGLEFSLDLRRHLGLRRILR